MDGPRCWQIGNALPFWIGEAAPVASELHVPACREVDVHLEPLARFAVGTGGPGLNEQLTGLSDVFHPSKAGSRRVATLGTQFSVTLGIVKHGFDDLIDVVGRTEQPQVSIRDHPLFAHSAGDPIQ